MSSCMYSLVQALGSSLQWNDTVHEIYSELEPTKR
jgi:hypothetical protein